MNLVPYNKPLVLKFMQILFLYKIYVPISGTQISDKIFASK